jgi:hypothetical protein
MNTLKILTNEILLKSYRQAIELGLSTQFIEILFEELKMRQILIQ